MSCDNATDSQAIRNLIERQFRAMSWRDGGPPDATAFSDDFHHEARLYPAARPVRPQSVDAFLERMTTLAGSSLTAFEEEVEGTHVRVFGNVAVAVVVCAAIENHKEVTRNVEMMLLVRDEGRWRIVAQAWDGASGSRAIPPDLVSAEAQGNVRTSG